MELTAQQHVHGPTRIPLLLMEKKHLLQHPVLAKINFSVTHAQSIVLMLLNLKEMVSMLLKNVTVKTKPFMIRVLLFVPTHVIKLLTPR